MMKRKKKWLFPIFSFIGIVLICVAVIVMISVHLNNPTKGSMIVKYSDSKAALLVVDVQNDITGNTERYGDTTGFITNVNEAIDSAKDNDMEILYIKNVYHNPLILLLSGGRFKAGTEGAELSDHLKIENNNVFEKSIGDSFSSLELEEYLVSHSIDTIYVIGADAAACVYSTARGGLNRGYSVNIIKEALITSDEKTLIQMLEQYEKDGINVINLQEFKELR